jgi:hypothetical protein
MMPGKRTTRQFAKDYASAQAPAIETTIGRQKWLCHAFITTARTPLWAPSN